MHPRMEEMLLVDVKYHPQFLERHICLRLQSH
jgi:hypothetical protein